MQDGCTFSGQEMIQVPDIGRNGDMSIPGRKARVNSSLEAHYRRNMVLCVRGLSNGIGPRTLPPLAIGVCPVQNMQTYTGGMLLLRIPTQLI